ncbi:hypothetical protein [Clostridium tertium]|uniref:hypothetical protein n=1 Tax=Clostridium tertium TaxID=1559 RepID=UPI00241DB8CB|nr:hypothetical protein [Clostridium tertium]
MDISDWAGIIGNVIGSIIGVVGAVWVLNKQFKKENNIEVIKENKKREQFRQTVVSFLRSEINHNRSVIKQNRFIYENLNKSESVSEIKGTVGISTRTSPRTYKFDDYKRIMIELFNNYDIEEVRKIIELYECISILNRYDTLNDVTETEYQRLRKLEILFNDILDSND